MCGSCFGPGFFGMGWFVLLVIGIAGAAVFFSRKREPLRVTIVEEKKKED